MFERVHIVFVKKLKHSLLTNNISGDRSQTEEWSNFLFINPLPLSSSSIWINIHKQLLWSRLCSKEKRYSILLLYTKQKFNKNKPVNKVNTAYKPFLTLY